MKEKFLKMLDGLSNADVLASPRFIVLKRFYEKLLEFFSEGLASFVASTLKVDVDDSFVQDEELLQKTIDVYVKLVVDLKKAFDSIHPDFFMNVIAKNEMTLTYRP